MLVQLSPLDDAKRCRVSWQMCCTQPDCSSTTSRLSSCRSDSESIPALELRVEAAEEVLPEPRRAAEVSLPREPPGPGSSTVPLPPMPELEPIAAVKPPSSPGCGQRPPTSLQPPGLESLEQETRFVFTLSGRMQQAQAESTSQFFAK